MIEKIKQYIIKLSIPKSPLKREIYYLKRAIEKTQRIVDKIYDMPFEYCCYHCANPQLYKIEEKLDRQIKRLRELENKIKGK